jgi:hypothetical protein
MSMRIKKEDGSTGAIWTGVEGMKEREVVISKRG